MVSVKGEEVDPRKLESPPYCAVMVCVPMVKEAVLNVATPFDSVPVPSVELPSRNVTVPVGGLPWPPCTLAVKVTVSPKLALVAELERVVVVGVSWPSGTIMRLTAGETDGAKLASPPYTAVMLYVPTVLKVVEKVAVLNVPSLMVAVPIWTPSW